MAWWIMSAEKQWQWWNLAVFLQGHPYSAAKCQKTERHPDKPCQLIRGFVIFIFIFLSPALLSFREIFGYSIAKSVLCYSWPFLGRRQFASQTTEDLWSGTPNSQARFNFHSNSESTSKPQPIPITQAALNPNPNAKPKPKPNPTHAHTISSCQWPGYLQNLGRGDLERCPMDCSAGRWMSGTPSFCVWG